MKYFYKIALFALFSFFQLSNFAQQNRAQGFFTSEANAIATNNEIFVSIKKYNPTQAEIENAAKPFKNSPMNYLMAPFDAVNISMYNKGFESKLFSLNNEGKVLWDLTLGYSDKSIPSPIKLHGTFIFTGESVKDADKVMIQKIDINGKVIWKKELDSLNNVNDIYVDENRVSALVSFDFTKKVEHGDGTFSESVYPIYFFVQLDNNTGKTIKKEYQKMGSYLSSLNFFNPLVNSDYSYFLNNTDSAAFLNITKQATATIVSQEMSKEHSILNLIAGEDSYHLLTLLTSGKNKRVYSLISDFYGKNKKYETEIPVDYNKLDRHFIYKNAGDSIITIIANPKNIFISYTNTNGKSILYKNIDNVISPVIAAGTIHDKVYILQVEGRNTPGAPGKIIIDYY